MRIDPRTRLVATLGFVIALTFIHSVNVFLSIIALVVCCIAVFDKGLLPIILKRGMLAIIIFSPLCIISPMSIGGDGVSFSSQIYFNSIIITMRIATIIMLNTALLYSLPIDKLTASMNYFGMPNKLTQLLSLIIRYTETWKTQTEQLLISMKLRGFKPKVNLHTLKTYSLLIAQILLRSLEQAEKVDEAMRLRGYTGQWAIEKMTPWGKRDFIISIATIIFCVGIIGAC